MASGPDHDRLSSQVPVSSIELTRHEEEASIVPRTVQGETIRMKKTVETIRVDESIPRSIVYADVERETPAEEDDGKIRELPDGSLSIPVLEEQIVVTRRTVVRERIIVRKRTVTETVHVEDEVRREHIEIEATEGLDLSIEETKSRNASGNGRSVPFPGSSADPNRRRESSNAPRTN